MRNFKKEVVLGLATVLFIVCGVLLMTAAGEVWDKQTTAINESVDHVTQTADAHTGLGGVGFAMFFAGLICIVIAALAGKAYKDATLEAC